MKKWQKYALAGGAIYLGMGMLNRRDQQQLDEISQRDRKQSQLAKQLAKQADELNNFGARGGFNFAGIPGDKHNPVIEVSQAFPQGFQVDEFLVVQTPKPGEAIAGSKVAISNGNQKKEVQLAGPSPSVLVIEQEIGLLNWAQILGTNLLVLSGGTPPSKKEINVTKTQFLMPSSLVNTKRAQMFTQLASIGGIRTSGPPALFGFGNQKPHWIPKNNGVFREGSNRFTVPVIDQKRFNSEWSKLVRPAGNKHHDVTALVRELSTFYATSWFFRFEATQSGSFLKQIIDAAIRVGTATVAGISAGWVGALKAAGAAILTEITKAIENVLDKDKKERQIVSKVGDTAGRIYGQSSTWSLGYNLGLQFTSQLHAPRVHSFPASLWFQSAAHNVIAGVIEQGVYPGIMLRLHLGGDGTEYHASVDGADLVSGASWNDAIKAKSTNREEYFVGA